MASTSFASLKAELDEACALLRGFTLGHRGFTARDGVAAMERVRGLCDRLGARFTSGPHAAKAATAVAAGRTRVRAAEVRLNLLRGKRQATGGGKEGAP